MDKEAFMRGSSFVHHGLIKTLAQIALEGDIEFQKSFLVIYGCCLSQFKLLVVGSVIHGT
jgi:hypothetical protein